MNKLVWILTMSIISLNHLSAQDKVEAQHFQKIVLNKKEKQVFSNRDSTSIVYIDTLIMKDRSQLIFLNKKDVKLVVKYAEIGKNTIIHGQGKENNASNFDIIANFQKLGSLHILARGQDANNGFRTFPNGDAGIVNLTYDTLGIIPQTTNKKAKNYLQIDVTPGGTHVTPASEIPLLYSRIRTAPTGLRGLPQGLVYSGSPGKEGEVNIKSN